jgi:AraC-like DNA-binding protein
MIPVYGLLYILLGLIIYSTYWIGIQGLIKSEDLSENAVAKTLPTESTAVYARLSDIELQTTVAALERLMQQEKLYLHETLNLRTLANRLQKDPNLISYLLNSILHKSFFDYVNEFRIEEVKSRINNPAYAHLKMVEIAYESGFNSKATFNRVFRKLTGKSPSDYRRDSE